jgi:hypothetical protein
MIMIEIFILAKCTYINVHIERENFLTKGLLCFSMINVLVYDLFSSQENRSEQGSGKKEKEELLCKNEKGKVIF